MNKIKSQFKDFWAYFRLTRYGAPNDANNGSRQHIFLLVGACATVLAVMFQTGMGGDTVALDFAAAFFVGAAIGIGITTSIKPSLLSVAPFSPKQRVVFSYLSAILMALIAFVFYIIVVLAFMLVVAFFAYISTGLNIFIAAEDDIISYATSGWYDAFAAIYFFYMFFTSFAISHIDRQKYRNIATVIWFVVTEALTLVLINCCADAYNRAVFNDYTGRHSIEIFSLLYTEYDYLAHPWVPVLVLGVLTVGVMGLSVWLSIKRHRSGKV